MKYTLQELPSNWHELDLFFTLDILDTYIKNVETQIILSIEDYKTKRDVIIQDEHEEYGIPYATIVHTYQGLDSETYDIDGIFHNEFPNLQRKSALISLFSSLEHELDKLCVLYKKTESYIIDLDDITDKGIHRAIRYLEKVAGLPIEKGDDRWGKIRSIQKIRNIIVHNDGKLLSLSGSVTDPSIIANLEFISISKSNQIILENGFLSYCLQLFKNFFSYINSLIQQKSIPKTADQKT